MDELLEMDERRTTQKGWEGGGGAGKRALAK